MFISMKTPIPLFLLLAALLVPSNVFSQTIGYWRFGNNPNDPGSLTAATVGTNLSSIGDVSQYALPGTGAGSLFPDVVPQNGLTNSRGVNIYFYLLSPRRLCSFWAACCFGE